MWVFLSKYEILRKCLSAPKWPLRSLYIVCYIGHRCDEQYNLRLISDGRCLSVLEERHPDTHPLLCLFKRVRESSILRFISHDGMLREATEVNYFCIFLSHEHVKKEYFNVNFHFHM
jgi:hypothetical protein